MTEVEVKPADEAAEVEVKPADEAAEVLAKGQKRCRVPHKLCLMQNRVEATPYSMRCSGSA